MTNLFNDKIDSKLTTLSTIWSDQKALNETNKWTISSLFIDLETIVRDEAIAIQETLECQVGLNKIALDLIELKMSSLDSKKDAKTLDILDNISFLFAYNIKFVLGEHTPKTGKNAGQVMISTIGVNRVKKMNKLDFMTKKIAKTATKLFVSNDHKNTEYMKALVKLIETKENEIIAKNLETAKNAGLGKMTINDKNIDAIIATLQNLKKVKA